MKNIRPILVLILISTIVPELLTGSTPLEGFLNPGTLIILFIGYGLSVLLIREFAVRNNVGLGGLFIIGLGYSILNEGLMAKTMIMSGTLPIAQYTGYGVFDGISVPWSLAIGAWHAVSSVIFPILAVHFIYREKSEEPWLGKKKSMVMATAILFLGTTMFFADYKIKGRPDQLLIFLFVMFVAFYLGRRMNKKISGPTKTLLERKIFWWGFSAILFFHFILTSLAGHKVSVIFFFTVFAGFIWIYRSILIKKGWLNDDGLLVFICGFYLGTALVGMAVAIAVLISDLVLRLIGGGAGIFFVWRLSSKAIVHSNREMGKINMIGEVPVYH